MSDNYADDSQTQIDQLRKKFLMTGAIEWRSLIRDPYHLVFVMPWWLFFCMITLIYFATNLFFAFLYLLDQNAIANAQSGSFTDAFAFSVQTLATIGYGAMFPQTAYAHAVVSIEALVGFIEVGLLTGLIFSRFAKSTARILFSKHAVVCNYNNVPTLMFRIANRRHNLILEAKLSAYLLIDEVSVEGQKLRRFYDLKLLRDKTPNFILSWLAMHPIDQSSPLFQRSPQELIDCQATILATVIGLDETVMQEIHARHSYSINEILWNYRFVDIFSYLPNGKMQINYRNFHEIEAV